MTELEISAAEADVPQQALRALRAASQRVRADGRPVVVLQGRQLVRFAHPAARAVVLRALPERFKVAVRIKKAMP